MATEDSTEGETTRVTRKGQVTIPKRVREQFGLEEGDEVRWTVDEEGIVLRKATQATGRGMLVEEDVPASDRDEMGEAIEREIREKRRSEWTPE